MRPGEQGPSGTERRAAWLIEAVRIGGLLGPADFVLGLGDQVDGGSLEAIRADLDAFVALTGEWPCPFFPVPGNHDISAREGDPDWEEPFLSAFGLPAASYSVVRDGLRLVMLNNAGTMKCDVAVTRRRGEWLAGELTTGEKLPTILCCHVPLVAIREPEVLAASCRFEPWRCAEPGILEAVRAHRDQIFAVLSGHLHLTGVVHDQGVAHICVAGVATFPGDYAVYTYADRRLDVEIHQVPKSLLDSESNIHGPPRHETEFIDSRHASPQEYVMGRADERRFSIELDNR